MYSSLLKKAAGTLANSFLLRREKTLFSENLKNWNLSLSKFDKLSLGLWLILNDYSKGLFPPVFLDQQKAYQAEKNYRFAIPGLSVAEVVRGAMSKPFWFGKWSRIYLLHYIQIIACLERLGIQPPSKILELGCGSGWMAEFLGASGFEVCGTTISGDDVTDANRRIESLKIKGLSPALKFIAVPMESVHSAVSGELFDAAFVYEALHHAFDWRDAIRSTHACLRKSGWLLICNEPNVLHTCVSYRVAKVSNTHEIGFRKNELISELRKIGFTKIISCGAKAHFWVRPHWLLAQK
ncbi:MAG: class I SAM-dependent methyltransferase [Verrucomicrobiota bacterium]